MSVITFDSNLFNQAVCGQTRGSLELTMTTVQELGDDGCAAGRPGAGSIDLNESRRHHVVVLQFPEHVLTGFHVVVRHVEHMSC